MGDILTWQVIPGATWTKHGRSGGDLVFNEFFVEYRDENGELVITARNVSVETETAPGER